MENGEYVKFNLMKQWYLKYIRKINSCHLQNIIHGNLNASLIMIWQWF